MPTALGLIKCDGTRLVGTFDVGGSPRYINVDVKPSNEPFECSNATVTYTDIAQLSGDCRWKGWIGRDDLQMDFVDGVSIVGSLATARSSSARIKGAGAWSMVKSALPTRAKKPQGNVFVNQFPHHDAAKNLAKVEREQQLINLGVPIIAIFGQSGTGKSTFINLITTEKQNIGTGLQSCTSDISVVEAKVGGKCVVIIDTPGIDDTRAGVREADILIKIANLLGYMGERRVWVTGVLFMHRISDNKFSQTADRVSNMLKNLCGNEAMSHLMLCTTMWDKVTDEEGDDRWKELRETGAWKEMLSKGAGTATMSNLDPNANVEAEEIVEKLIERAEPVEVAIQDEMVNRGLKVAETSAGKVLDEQLREAQAEAERELKELRDRLRGEKDANVAKAQEAIRAQEQEVARLKALVDEHARERQAQAQQLKREQERAKREIKELHDQMRKEGAANVAKVQEELLAREREALQLKQQMDELNGDQKAEAKQLKQERKSVVQAKKEARKQAKKEAAAQAAKEKEETSVQQREINEMKRQVNALAGKPQQRPGFLQRLGLFGGH